MRQELPLLRAKTDDRLGLYIRALAVALLAARLHFDMEDTDLKGRESRRASVSSDAKAVKGVPND